MLTLELYLYILYAMLITSLLIFISYFFIIRNPSIEKNSAYECGFQPFDDARIPFDIHFYLVGILFLIFDLEIMFLVPWAVCILNIGMFGYNVFIIFIFILTLGFIYEWKKGALNW